jgi:hypothetical protein
MNSGYVYAQVAIEPDDYLMPRPDVADQSGPLRGGASLSKYPSGRIGA